MYGFDSKPYPPAPFPADRTEVDTALAQLATGDQPGTALYGAVKHGRRRRLRPRRSSGA